MRLFTNTKEWELLRVRGGCAVTRPSAPEGVECAPSALCVGGLGAERRSGRKEAIVRCDPERVCSLSGRLGALLVHPWIDSRFVLSRLIAAPGIDQRPL